MSQIGDIAKAAFDLLTPEGQTERLTFRRFEGRALAKAAETGGTIDEDSVETVILQLNPESISNTQPKIIQKVQTGAPGKFVIFDWGTDLLSLTITGNTGNMIPGILQSGFDPTKGMIDEVATKLDPGFDTIKLGGVREAIGGVLPYAQNIMIGTMTYHELLNMSPKYRTFARLRDMYRKFDADLDVLTLEMGEIVYRGYFTDFSFTQEAGMPWNWKYTIGFVSLSNLLDSIRRGDDSFPDNEDIID